MSDKKLKILIIAYGNRDREDDGAGWHILAALAARLHLSPPQDPGAWSESADGSVRLLYLFQLLPEMAEDLKAYHQVYFLDAHNSPQLEEIVFEPVEPSTQRSAFTHHMSPAELLDITHTISGSAPKAYLLSVRGYSFSFSPSLSERTAALCAQASRQLFEKLESELGSTFEPHADPASADGALAAISRGIWQYSTGKPGLTQVSKPIIREHTLELAVNGQTWMSFICSPIELEALITGFLWNENIISNRQDITNLQFNDDFSRVEVSLTRPATKPTHFHRTSTGLTVSGTPAVPAIAAEFRISAEDLIARYQEFAGRQALHDQVGGFHSAALSDGQQIRWLVEDLGRHNCIDKLAGWFLLQGQPFPPRVLLLSGRISSEMVLKSQTMGVQILVSRTTATSLAADLASQVGMTLVGYLRRGQFDVYSHPERIIA